MILSYVNGVFIAECSFADKDTVKAAGFWWHGAPCTRTNCAACKTNIGFKKWWTADHAKASRLAAFANPSAKTALAGFASSIEASKAKDFDGVLPVPEGLEYLPFQKAGIAYAVGRKHTLFADQPGLGKTIQAVGVVNANPSPGNTLILCPASLRLNWAREWKKWSIHKGMKVHIVLDGEPVPLDANVVIVNYDRLLNRTTLKQVFGYIAKYIKAGITQDKPGLCPLTDGSGNLKVHLLDQLMSRNWDYLIADEAHYCKNQKTARTQLVLGSPAKGRGVDRIPAVAGLVDKANHFLPLTGTPILNKPSEIFPLLQALDPGNWQGKFFDFGMRYCGGFQKNAGRKMVWDFNGSSNLGELQARLRGTVMVRRKKEDVLTELPPKRRQIIPLVRNGASEIVEKEAAAWEAALRTKMGSAGALLALTGTEDEEVYMKAAEALADSNKILFTQIAKERHDVAVAKIPAVIEHLHNTFDEGVPKIICFAYHHDVIDALAAEFGTSCVTVTGNTPTADRQAAVDRFQNDPTCTLFLGNIQAAGVGLTLTAASHVVFAELDWVPANVTQAEDRAHRYGQLDSVLVQHLVFDGSIDAKMVEFVIHKQKVADLALDKK